MENDFKISDYLAECRRAYALIIGLKEHATWDEIRAERARINAGNDELKKKEIFRRK